MSDQFLTVPTPVAIQMKVMEFDKVIAEAKAPVANLESQRAQFIYDSNIKVVQQQYPNSEVSVSQPK